MNRARTKKMRTQINPSALYWASFNSFELRLPGQCVLDCSGPGAVDSAVQSWVQRVREQVQRDALPNGPTPHAIRAELKEYGAWGAAELLDDDLNFNRLVWIAACNIADDDAPDCSEPVRSDKHTPGPWKVMPCPVNFGKHALHDYRWIATAEATVEYGHDPRSWAVENGSLICEMRDGPVANARLIAAAPELLAALRRLALQVESITAHEAGPTRDELLERLHIGHDAGLREARAAIAKATA